MQSYSYVISDNAISTFLGTFLYFEYIKRSRKVLIALSDITYEYDCIFEKLVEELQPYDFVVNCRGNLVNLRHIEKIKGFIIYMDNGKELQIAQRRSNDFREEVNKKTLDMIAKVWELAGLMVDEKR